MLEPTITAHENGVVVGTFPMSELPLKFLGMVAGDHPSFKANNGGDKDFMIKYATFLLKEKGG